MESAKKYEGFNESLKPSSDSMKQPNAGNTTNDRPQSYTAASTPAARIMFRPTPVQVRDYMRTCTGRTLRNEVLEEEVRAFLNYNDMKGWQIVDWRGAILRWVNRTESRKGLSIYEDPQQNEADEERRKAQEERKRVDTFVDRIRYRAFTDEDGVEALKIFDMLQRDDYTDESRAGIAKKVGQRLIDLWARTYGEIITMETYSTASGGNYAMMIKERIYSGKPFVNWFWHGMEMRVKDYLEHWQKGPGRPIRRLVPIKIGAQGGSGNGQAVPAFWTYLKTLIDRRAFNEGVNGSIAKKIDEQAANHDFGGRWGPVAMWIVTGKVVQPQPPSETRTNQPQPLKGIINKSLRDMGAQT